VTGETIRTAGRCLYGHSWRVRFEIDFGVSGRKLQRMLKGDDEMGPEMWGRVVAALAERRSQIDSLLRRP
jgi:hypothetical protein